MSDTVKETVLLSVQTFKPTNLIESLRDKQESDGCVVLTNLALLFRHTDGTDEERFSLDSVLTVKHLSKPGSLRLDIFFKNNIQKSLNFARHDKSLVLHEFIPILSDIGVGRLSVPLGIPENLAEIHAHLHIQPVSLFSPSTQKEPLLVDPTPAPLLELSILPPKSVDKSPPEPEEEPMAQQSVAVEPVDTVNHSVVEQPAIRETIDHPNFDPVNEIWNLSTDSTEGINQDPGVLVPRADEAVRTALDIELDFFGEQPEESGIRPFAKNPQATQIEKEKKEKREEKEKSEENEPEEDIEDLFLFTKKNTNPPNHPTVGESPPSPEVKDNEITTEGEEGESLFISSVPSLDSIPDDELFYSPATKRS